MPDFTLTNAFIKTFSDNIRLLTQQMVNQFRDKVQIHNIVGQKYYVDYVGTSNPVKRAGSTAPTAHSSMAHTRRRIMSDTYDDAKLVDRNDIFRMGTDPALTPSTSTRFRAEVSSRRSTAVSGRARSET